MEKVIEVSNLTKEYKGKKAVDNLSFDVYEGEILGLLGPNGSGKSTTINSILALLKYQGGSIKIFGEEMKPDSYDIKAKIGVIFQDVAVFNELNVYDNINYFCGLYIKDKNTRKQYVEDAINLVGQFHQIGDVNVRSAFVRKYDGIILHAVPDHTVDSFTLMAIQYPGLEITHMLLLFARFDIFQRGAFGHHRNVLLSLGSPATCTLASLDFLTGHRKVTLIQFYHPFQCIPCIPVAHRPAEFVYHRPYRFVTLQS